jgi:hypothetical protein
MTVGSVVDRVCNLPHHLFKLHPHRGYKCRPIHLDQSIHDLTPGGISTPHNSIMHSSPKNWQTPSLGPDRVEVT